MDVNEAPASHRPRGRFLTAPMRQELDGHEQTLIACYRTRPRRGSRTDIRATSNRRGRGPSRGRACLKYVATKRLVGVRMIQMEHSRFRLRLPAYGTEDMIAFDTVGRRPRSLRRAWTSRRESYCASPRQSRKRRDTLTRRQKKKPAKSGSPRAQAAQTAPPPRPAPGRSHTVRYVVALIVLVAVVGGLAYALLLRAGGDDGPVVVVPTGFDDLDPQFRSLAKRYIDWTREEPSSAERHAQLALVYAANQVWLEARASFEKALRIDPNHTLARYYLAIARGECGDRDGEIETLWDIVGRNADFAPAYHRLGARLIELGEHESAGPQFRRAVALAPNQAAGYIGLGDAAVRTGAHAEAIKQLTKALSIAPGAAQAHYLLGLAYRGLGKMDDAKRELAMGHSATKLYLPDAWTVRQREFSMSVADQITLADDYAMAGQPDKGVEILETALKWHAGNVAILNALGVVYINRGQPARAREVLLEAAVADDARFETYANLSAAELAMGEMDQALAHIERAIELAPGIAHAHFVRGRILLWESRNEEALESLHEAIRLDPSNHFSHHDLGNTYLNLGRSAEALESFEAAFERSPSFHPALLGIFEASLRLGDYEQARRALANAERLAPNAQQVQRARQRLERITNR